jgi:exonuclease 3'-5' domain-containing protein 1
MENASRAGPKTFVSGLEKAIQRDLSLGYAETQRWTNTKKGITSLMSTDIFAVRPMDSKTVEYCVNDLLYLPNLRAFYLDRLKGDWPAKVIDATNHRIQEAYSAGYQP